MLLSSMCLLVASNSLENCPLALWGALLVYHALTKLASVLPRRTAAPLLTAQAKPELLSSGHASGNCPRSSIPATEMSLSVSSSCGKSRTFSFRNCVAMSTPWSSASFQHVCCCKLWYIAGTSESSFKCPAAFVAVGLTTALRCTWKCTCAVAASVSLPPVRLHIRWINIMRLQRSLRSHLGVDSFKTQGKGHRRGW